METRGPPIASPFRRLDTEKLAVAKAEFAALERDGIIRRSSSPWVSPLHMREIEEWRNRQAKYAPRYLAEAFVEFVQDREE